MSSKILNVAVLGCAEMSQIVHIPEIMVHDHLFKIVALCDISKESANHCADRFGFPRTACYYDLQTMLTTDKVKIDLVFIVTADQYHAQHAIECANAGKHVLLEKPMAQTIAEAEAIEAARVRNSVVIFIGYMRRYAPAFERVKQLIENKPIKYVRVRDIFPKNVHFTSQSSMNVKYFRDLPPDAIQDMAKRKTTNIETVLGRPGTTKDIMSWGLLGGLGSHGFSAMRELVGMPTRCLAATRRGGDLSNWINALFDFGEFSAVYEMGVDDVSISDSHIQVYTDDMRITVSQQTPFIRGLETLVKVQKCVGDGEYSEEIIRPTYIDPYSFEYKRLFDAIVSGKEYKTTPADAKNDIQIAQWMMKAFPR